VVEAWSDERREQMMASAEMVLSVELPAFQAYRPDERRLEASARTFAVLVGREQQAPFFGEAAAWLARHLGAEVEAAPGSPRAAVHPSTGDGRRHPRVRGALRPRADGVRALVAVVAVAPGFGHFLPVLPTARRSHLDAPPCPRRALRAGVAPARLRRASGPPPSTATPRSCS
jgi:hypothetical protein